MFSIPKHQLNDFKHKVFEMNIFTPVEVRKIDRALLDFSLKIKPDEYTMKQHSSCAQKIAEILKENSTYKIDRLLFAGSFGKRTNIRSSDADCVFFINNQHPPFDEVLKEFYDICNKPAVRNSFNKFHIAMNKNSLNFQINDFEMDVVLATNFVEDLKKHQSLCHIQQKAALKLIQVNPTELGYKYSSSLAEASVFFMRTRVGFANEIARIAKFWFKTLGLSNISGASTFIELVAVYAARKGRRGPRKYSPYLKAFIRFLEMVVHFERLNVKFKRCNAMFKQHSPGENILPRVIDPVNPYNNFARYWKDDDVRQIKSSAAATLAKIQNKIVNPGASEVDLAKILFDF